MSWNRYRLGNVSYEGLVHFLFEWRKDRRAHWDTQCNIGWEGRDNTNARLRPRATKKPITCVECIAYHMQTRAPW